MENTKSLFAEDTTLLQKQWQKIYLLGGIAAIISFITLLFDISFGSISAGNLTELPQTAIERFSEFQKNWLLGLYHLDFLNVFNTFIMVPMYFALFAIHRKRNLPYAAFAFILSLIGVIIFVTTNSALPMLELSRKYYDVVDESQKILLAAAGEAMLVRGVHGGLGVFIVLPFHH